ncbi:MAG TPA: outer membrane beta-barrel protein, partial [Candidatus Krumholzibacteria bacterium]|nr:outer membrane beta-barrel protein [Candidatus Krumholzibacteria bacterium]
HRDVVLSFQPGWMQKGAKVVFGEEETPDSTETFVVNQSWATMPVYFRIDSDDRGFYAGGGVSVDILLESNLEHDGATIDNKDGFDDVDWVYQFTAGYLHDMGSHSLFLEARYLQGIRSIASSVAGASADVFVQDVKSNGLRLVAGFMF